MKTIDGKTGEIIDDGLGNVSDSGSGTPTGTPNVNAIANGLGVPPGWVLIAGIGLLLLAAIFKKR